MNTTAGRRKANSSTWNCCTCRGFDIKVGTSSAQARQERKFQGLKTYYRAKENCAYGMCKTKWAVLKSSGQLCQVTSLSFATNCSSHLFLRHLFLLPSLALDFSCYLSSGTRFSWQFLLLASLSLHLLLLTSLALDTCFSWHLLLWALVRLSSFPSLDTVFVSLRPAPLHSSLSECRPLLYAILLSSVMLCSALVLPILVWLFSRCSTLLVSAPLCVLLYVIRLQQARGRHGP